MSGGVQGRARDLMQRRESLALSVASAKARLQSGEEALRKARDAVISLGLDPERLDGCLSDLEAKALAEVSLLESALDRAIPVLSPYTGSPLPDALPEGSDVLARFERCQRIRDLLNAARERARGVLDQATLERSRVESECRRLGVDPGRIDEEAERARKNAEEALDKFETSLVAAESALRITPPVGNRPGDR